jgi:hypothetical protein
MAFTSISSTSIEVGDALKKDLFDLIKGNEDDLNTRLTAVESSSKKIDVFKFLLLNGSSFSTVTGLAYFRAEDTFTITKAAIQIFEKNSLAGFLEIDILKSTTNLNSASFTSIFTTKPKITYSTAADYDISTNQVLNSAMINIVPGNYLRLDITIAPTGGVIPKILIDCFGA